MAYVQVQRLRGNYVVDFHNTEFHTEREYRDFIEPLEREARKVGETIRTVAEGAPLCYGWRPPLGEGEQ